MESFKRYFRPEIKQEMVQMKEINKKDMVQMKGMNKKNMLVVKEMNKSPKTEVESGVRNEEYERTIC